MSKVFAFLKDESGATAIEYGLIAAGISVVIIAAVNAIGTSLNAKFDYISTSLNNRRAKSVNWLKPPATVASSFLGSVLRPGAGLRG